jgi:hypothetical protein
MYIYRTSLFYNKGCIYIPPKLNGVPGDYLLKSLGFEKA